MLQYKNHEMKYTDGNYAREILYERWELDTVKRVMKGETEVILPNFPQNSQINYSKNIEKILEYFGFLCATMFDDDSIMIIGIKDPGRSYTMRNILKQALPYLFKEDNSLFMDKCFKITPAEFIAEQKKVTQNEVDEAIIKNLITRIRLHAINAAKSGNPKFTMKIGNRLMMHETTRHRMIDYITENGFVFNTYNASKEEIVISII